MANNFGGNKEMEQATIRQTVTRLREYLEKGGYARGTIRQFKSTTNQLLKFMDSEGIEKYSTDVGLRFLQTNYAYDPQATSDHSNMDRCRYLQKLSEFQLYGAVVPKKHTQNYKIPEAFSKATEAFLAYRRFEGIIEKNMC